MSSMIEDLPGPQEEEMSQEFHSQTQNHHKQQHKQQNHQQHIQPQMDENIENATTEMFTQPITSTIKKKTASSDSIITQIKSEFNTYNILLVVILYISCIPESNDLIRRLLLNFTSVGYSHTIITIIKCILLVILFIIIKKFLGKNTLLV